MKIEKDGEQREIQDQNWSIWKQRGWSKAKPKKRKAPSVETAAAEGGEKAVKPRSKKRKRSRKPKPGPSD